MMDITTLFKANVQTVNLRNKDLGAHVNKPNKKLVNKKKSLFISKTQNILRQINKLHELLLEKSTSYMNVTQHLQSSSKSHMSDEERDEIDTGARQIIATCSQLIKDLKREVATSSENVSPQNIEHRELSIFLMEEYLTRVCKIYSGQMAVRVKRAVEMKRLSRLNTENPKHSSESGESNSLKIQELNGDVRAASTSGGGYEEELSAEEMQMLEQENNQLFNELSTITEEVKQLESKVVHIAELQELFTEKVLDQDKNLDRLMTTVVGSTENVKEANEQIRQAIQRKAGLRVWMLFFLLVMSFSLLFLDWYNP